MTTPLVSVVMGCYNSEKFIIEAIDSILSQTISDIEFIIIDDCSKDKTKEIIKSYHDDRIILVENSVNKGLGYNLNYGVNISRGRYIARMDADDISLPKRFEKQVKYLESHPDVVCVGTWSKKIGDINMRSRLFSRYIKTSTDYERLKALILFGTPMMHPSVMFNGDMLRANGINYDPSFRKAQDYELWSRIIWNYRITNIPEVLLYYRYSSGQASNKNRSEQVSLSDKIYRRLLEKVLGREPAQEEVDVHTMISTRSALTNEELDKAITWIQYLYENIRVNRIVNPKSFASFISDRWVAICRESLRKFDRFRYFNSFDFVKLSIWETLKLYS